MAHVYCVHNGGDCCHPRRRPCYHRCHRPPLGQISNLLYDEIVGTCGMAYLKQGGAEPTGCAAALSRVATEAGGEGSGSAAYRINRFS